MVTVKYSCGFKTVGMLSWVEEHDGTLTAIGGIDPGAERPGELVTTVYTDTSCRCLQGWIHPCNIREVSGADAPELVELPELIG